MVVSRRTLCALAVLSAPLGSLVAAQAALATTPSTPAAPTIESVAVNGSDLSSGSMPGPSGSMTGF